MQRALDDPERGLGGIDVKVDRRGARPPRRDRRRRRADGAHRPGGGGPRGAGGRARPRSRGTARRRPSRRKAVVYDRQGDAHYDVISAFIKSIRGSDPDADAVLAGPDARGRRGRALHRAADDRARVGGHRARRPARAARSATAAAHAVEHVGLPEARLNLAEAAIYLARAPKSNSVYTALAEGDGGRRERRRRPGAPPRLVLSGRASGSGTAKGYKYPHDFPGHQVEQEYRPVRFQGTPLLRAVGRGRGDLAERPTGTRRAGSRGYATRRPGHDPTTDHEGDETMAVPRAHRRRHRVDHPGGVLGTAGAVPVHRAAQHVPRPREHQDDDRLDARGDRPAPARGPRIGGADEPRDRSASTASWSGWNACPVWSNRPRRARS